MKLLLGGCLVLALVLANIGVAWADKVDDLIGKLKDTDNKVRLSAALNLGKLGDKRAIPPLTTALKDGDKTVRGVAAAALAKLLDATVDPTILKKALSELDSMRQNDPDSFARGQAEKAYQIVKGLASSGGSTSAGGGLNGKTVYVEIGPLADTTKTPDAKMVPLARKTIDKALAKDFATKWPGGKSPSKKELTAAGVKGFYVDGTLTMLDVATTANGATITCRAALLVATFPEKSVFGLLDPAKNKAEVDVGNTASEIAEGKSACVEYMVDNVIKKSVIPLIKSK